MPFLQYAESRDLRKQIWDAYRKRGDNDNAEDNKKILIAIANLRNQKARLLGYETHAHYVLEESMAQNPDNVYELLQKLWTPAIKMAEKEAAKLSAMLQKDHPNATLEPWDWRYYEEKLRAKEFNFDENELKPYFELNKVKEGIFYTVHKLYGLNFKLIDTIPTYHPEATAYEVTKEGKHVGVLYMDFHPRESKRGGAWMTAYRKQSNVNGTYVHPVISIVCNFTKPTGNNPALLTFDEVTTFFHEFGHAIHGLLSNVHYRSLSGTSVPRDFVELPSQILECWAAEPEVLQVYAKHYQTGEVIPQVLLDKMNKSNKYGQGFAAAEYLAASLLDMAYHTQKQDILLDANSFESDEMQKIGLISAIIPRYRSTYFSHIFSGGYSAGYYSYIWSELLDSDGFDYFKSQGIFNPQTAQSFYDNILSKGGTDDPATLYRRFRGQDPSVDALIKRKGLGD
jgi:peptidyl-dipeptidase Dcp